MEKVIKLSHPPSRSFWEIPILFEDEHLLILDKPYGLAVSPNATEPDRPSLLKLLHAGIAEGKPWAQGRSLQYLMNAHRLDADVSGVLVLARSKPVLIALANVFGSEKPCRSFLALVRGRPAQDNLDIETKLSVQPATGGFYRVSDRSGKRTRTQFHVLEKFGGWTLLKCEPLTARPHQIRAHLRHARLPIAGDSLYNGPPLLLSRIKPGYRLKPNRTERPLVTSMALHADSLNMQHPVTGEPLMVTAPLPREFSVALKYLRRYAGEAMQV